MAAKTKLKKTPLLNLMGIQWQIFTRKGVVTCSMEWQNDLGLIRSLELHAAYNNDLGLEWII